MGISINDIEVIKVSELPEIFQITPSDFSMVVQGGKSYKIREINRATVPASVFEIQTTESEVSFQVPAGKLILWMVFLVSDEIFVSIAKGTVGNVVFDELPLSAAVPNEIQCGWYALAPTDIFITGLSGNTTIKYFLLG